jgi:hypothetical protein
MAMTISGPPWVVGISPVSGYGIQTSGTWIKANPIARVSVTGTGVLSMDSRSRAGTVTSATFTASYAGAAGAIDWPYPGDDAIEVRFTFPTTLAVEVI